MSLAFPFSQGSNARASNPWKLVRSVLNQGRTGILLATIGVDLAALALPIFILQIYDRVLPNQTTITLLVLVLGLSAVLIIDICLRVLRARVSTWTAARFEHALRMSAVDRLLETSLETFNARTPASYIESVTAVTTLRDFEAAQRFEIRIDLLFAAIYLGLIAYLGGTLALVPLTMLVIFGAIAFMMGSLLHASIARRVRADEARQDSLMKVLRGIHTVKALALNHIILRRHETFQENSAAAVQRVMMQSSMVQTTTVAFAQLNTVALLAFGAVRILDGSMTLGAVAACTLLAGRAIQPLQTAMGVWTNYQNVRLARQEIGSVLALPAELPAAVDRVEIAGEIELDNVSFRYGPNQPYLLENVSLKVKPGSIIGIEAASGAGKTTLLRMILGLVLPEQGEVRVDGRDITTIAPDCLRRQAALVSRDAAIFRGSIIDNLTNFRDGECINEALYLSFLLGADEPIRRLPGGFDHHVEAGDSLPAGLRQRIGMVRAMANSPKIVLFDEADAGLDQDSRARLVELLKDIGRTAAIIVISPHADILDLASARFRLSQGRLIPITPTGRADIKGIDQ